MPSARLFIFCVRLLQVCSFDYDGQCEGLNKRNGQQVRSRAFIFINQSNANAETRRLLSFIMKKKFMLAAVAIVAAASITLASCSKNPCDKAIDMVKDATEQVKKAKSMEEIDNIGRELESKFDKMEAEYKDVKPTEAQQQEMTKAYEELGEAVEQARAKFY